MNVDTERLPSATEAASIMAEYDVAWQYVGRDLSVAATISSYVYDLRLVNPPVAISKENPVQWLDTPDNDQHPRPINVVIVEPEEFQPVAKRLSRIPLDAMVDYDGPEASILCENRTDLVVSFPVTAKSPFSEQQAYVKGNALTTQASKEWHAHIQMGDLPFVLAHAMVNVAVGTGLKANVDRLYAVGYAKKIGEELHELFCAETHEWQPLR